MATTNRGSLSEATFTRNLRFELAGEEGRALVTSYAFSFTLGVLWLILVYMSPARPDITLLPEDSPPPIDVRPLDTLPTPPEPGPVEATAASAPSPAPRPRTGGGGGNRNNDAAIAGAFGANPNQGGVIGDVSGALRGVEVSTGTGGSPSLGGGKVVLGVGEGGSGTRTPGRGGFGSGVGTGAGSGVGSVSGIGGGVGRASVRVSAPTPVRVSAVGGPGRDVSELGSYVRDRQAQLQFCYQEHGLKANPNLAGTVVVSLAISNGGNVTSANIVSRTWSGAGASEAESCIRSKLAGWRFPPSEQGAGTYNFPFNFTR